MDLPAALEELRKFADRIHPLSEAEWEHFSSRWQPFQAKRKTVLTAAGETEKFLYFVLEGVQRAFYQTPDGKEATLVFTYPFSFSGVADSLLLRQPSKYFFETLTASRFIRCPYGHLEEMMTQHRNVETIVRKAVTFSLSGVLERQIELQCYSAEEKFRTLLTRSPHVLTLIPHKYLASYLGIDATTFSKLLGTARI